MQYRNRTPRSHGSAAQDRPHVPMGDHRYEDLMRQLGEAFSKADDGEEKRRAARERELQHERWMAERKTVIRDILATMRQYGITAESLA